MKLLYLKFSQGSRVGRQNDNSYSPECLKFTVRCIIESRIYIHAGCSWRLTIESMRYWVSHDKSSIDHSTGYFSSIIHSCSTSYRHYLRRTYMRTTSFSFKIDILCFLENHCFNMFFPVNRFAPMIIINGNKYLLNTF